MRDHTFAYHGQNCIKSETDTSWLFLTSIYGHLKKKIRSFAYRTCFYGHFCLRDSGFYLMKKCCEFVFLKNYDLENAVKYSFFHEKGWGKMLWATNVWLLNILMKNRLVSILFFDLSRGPWPPSELVPPQKLA